MKFITAALVVVAALATSSDAFISRNSLSQTLGLGGHSNNNKNGVSKIYELSGNYCGNYMANMVSGKVTMNPSDTTFDLTVKAFSNPETGCKHIKYIYDVKSGKVAVPDATDKSTCLGDMLASGNLSLDVSFDNKKGAVTLDLGIAKLGLTHC